MMSDPRKLGLLGALIVVACHGEEQPALHKWRPLETPTAPTASAGGVEVDPAKLGLFAPLPTAMDSKTNRFTEDKATLGRMLFFDARLSKDHNLSCNTCHDLAAYGVDGKDVEVLSKKQKGRRNTPTVYNAALQSAQGWDGRAETVEDQVKAHLLTPGEMGLPDRARVVDAMKAVPEYVEAFKKAFPDEADPVSLDSVANAIGAFESKLVTPAKWDRFLGGDKAALTDEEKNGFLKFVDTGCGACHMGALVGGTMFQKLGLAKPWPNQRDKGREDVTKSPSDELMFEASQLRNVDRTAPYLHDGSAKTLEEAVKMMAVYQLNKELSDADVQSIVTWLKTLTGLILTEYVKKPDLPGVSKASKSK